MPVSPLLPAPHTSLVSQTYDDGTQPAHLAPRRPRTADFVLDRVAQGDARAARECIDRFGSLIWSIARRLTRSRADAEDAVHEIFADLWRSARRFDPEQGSEEVFVTMIARRRLIDRMRDTARRDRSWVIDDRDPLGWANVRGSAYVCAEALAAGRGVMLLRTELRQVLKLAFLQGLNYSEIANTLELPLATVKTMMRRGLIQAREFMSSQSSRH